MSACRQVFHELSGFGSVGSTGTPRLRVWTF